MPNASIISRVQSHLVKLRTIEKEFKKTFDEMRDAARELVKTGEPLNFREEEWLFTISRKHPTDPSTSSHVTRVKCTKTNIKVGGIHDGVDYTSTDKAKTDFIHRMAEMLYNA